MKINESLIDAVNNKNYDAVVNICRSNSNELNLNYQDHV